jgi:ribonuclease P protein component
MLRSPGAGVARLLGGASPGRARRVSGGRDILKAAHVGAPRCEGAAGEQGSARPGCLVCSARQREIRRRACSDEAHFPTEQPAAGPQARFSPPHVDSRRPCNPALASPAGAGPSLCLSAPVHRVSSRTIFGELRATDRRARKGSVAARYVEVREGTPCLAVAYAVNRAVGGAVERNLLRRRLRAIVRESALACKPGAYVLSAGRQALDLPFEQLRECVVDVMVRASRSR